MERLTVNSFEPVLGFLGVPSVFILEGVSTKFQSILHNSTFFILSMIDESLGSHYNSYHQLSFSAIKKSVRKLLSYSKSLQLSAYYTNDFATIDFWKVFCLSKSATLLGNIGHNVVVSGVFTGFRERKNFHSFYPPRAELMESSSNWCFIPSYANGFLAHLKQFQMCPVISKLEILAPGGAINPVSVVMGFLSDELIAKEQLLELLKPFHDIGDAETMQRVATAWGLGYKTRHFTELGVTTVYDAVLFTNTTGKLRPIFWLAFQSSPNHAEIVLPQRHRGFFFHLLLIKGVSNEPFGFDRLKVYGQYFAFNKLPNHLKCAFLQSRDLYDRIEQVSDFGLAVFYPNKKLITEANRQVLIPQWTKDYMHSQVRHFLLSHAVQVPIRRIVIQALVPVTEAGWLLILATDEIKDVIERDLGGIRTDKLEVELLQGTGEQMQYVARVRWSETALNSPLCFADIVLPAPVSAKCLYFVCSSSRLQSFLQERSSIRVLG